MNTEDKTKLLYKLGYGLKYTFAIAITILAIWATCFIYTSISTYFGPPLQPMFDQERLGQLGDFLGGTLNPIFGFATVCLLLWSVFIQRKELSLTRDELKKSSTALDNQYNLAKDEYDRKQLEALLEKNLLKYNQILDKKHSPAKCVITRKIKPDSDYSYKSLNQLQKYLQQDLKPGDEIRSFGNTDHIELCELHEESYHQCRIILSLYKEISSLTNLNSIKIDYRKTSTETYEKLKLINPAVPDAPPNILEAN